MSQQTLVPPPMLPPTNGTSGGGVVSVVMAKPTIPPPLVNTKLVNDDSSAGANAGVTLSQDQSTNATTKKRKRSSSANGGDERKAKKAKANGEKKKTKKNRDKENVSIHDLEDSDEEGEETGVTMSGSEFEEFVQAIMEITRSNDPKTAMLMLEHKLNIIDTLKTWFGLELHDDDTKLVQLLNDNQLSGIYKGLVLGKLVLAMDEFQKDGPVGFINHLIESEASGKHLLPYSFCCWKSEGENIQATLEENKRQAAMNPSSKNFWMLNKEDEVKKALRRTKFWYCFGREMDKAIQSGQIDEATLTWEDLKAYCEAFWYENEEGKKFRKYYVAINGAGSGGQRSTGQSTQFQSFSAWPIPKGAYKEQRDFLLGVWPFVQIYFLSPKEGPVVLVGGNKKESVKAVQSDKPSFDFRAALEKRHANKNGQQQQYHQQQQQQVMMMVDDDDDSDSEQEAKKSKKHKKSKSKGGRLAKFTDSQAEDDD